LKADKAVAEVDDNDDRKAGLISLKLQIVRVKEEIEIANSSAIQ
jgi:hypothetical protein